MHFLARKINFSSLNFFSFNNWKIKIYEYLKTFHEGQKFLDLKKIERGGGVHPGGHPTPPPSPYSQPLSQKNGGGGTTTPPLIP